LKKITVSHFMTVLTNLGVIAGILFLAFELQQNSESLDLQVRLDRESVQRQGIRNRLEYPEVVDATAKAMRGESLSVEDEIRLGDLNRGALTDWRFGYMQMRDGVLELEAIPINQWRQYFHEIAPRMPQSWEEYKLGIPHDTEFIEWFEENIVNEP
jgi:hypothetical protein